MKALGERLNPVLVKEVRQALRGRMFRILFMLTLSAAAAMSVVVLARLSSDSDASVWGRRVFQGMHAVYAVAVIVLLPLIANRSMASERDERTLDALLVSGLSTARIVRGKWLASGVLLLLFLSACAPFLALGYVLYGLDVLTSLFLVACTSALGWGTSLLGILLAAVARNRVLDTLLLALQVFVAIGGLSMWLALAARVEIFGAFRSVTLDEFLWGAGVWLVLFGLLLAWLFGLAVAAVAHPEENASTRLRIVALLSTLAMALSCLLPTFLDGDGETSEQFLMVAVFLVCVFNLTLVTEPDALGRRASADLRHGRVTRPLAAWLLPGGGRGMVLFVAQLALLVAAGVGALLWDTNRPDTPFVGLLTAVVVALTYSGYPAWFASRPRLSAQARNSLRLLMLVLMPMVALASMLVGLVSGSKSLAEGEALINPFWVLSRNVDRSGAPEFAGLVLHGLLALGALALNWRRMWEAHSEVEALRRAPEVRREAA